jgi:hypothetical protein
MIVQDENPKVPTFITIRHSIRSSAQDFAKLDYKSFSRLIEVSLLEYMKNHAADIRNPVAINIQDVAPGPRKIKVNLCEIAHCKNTAGSAIGTFKEKNYRLCKDHEGKYIGVKGWSVT